MIIVIKESVNRSTVAVMDMKVVPAIGEEITRIGEGDNKNRIFKVIEVANIPETRKIPQYKIVFVSRVTDRDYCLLSGVDLNSVDTAVSNFKSRSVLL